MIKPEIKRKYAKKMTQQEQGIHGVIKNAASKSGECKACKANQYSTNPEKPPLHPNCKCSVISKMWSR